MIDHPSMNTGMIDGKEMNQPHGSIPLNVIGTHKVRRYREFIINQHSCLKI